MAKILKKLSTLFKGSPADSKPKKHSLPQTKAQTDLFIAIRKQKTQDAIFLIEDHHISINTQSSDGCSLLQSALLHKDFALANWLIQKGAELNTTNKHYEPVIITATRLENIEQVEQILFHHANPNVTNGEGNTALHIASQKDHRPIIIRLLEKGADPHIKNRVGQTAISIANQNRQDSLAKLLASRYEDVKARPA